MLYQYEDYRDILQARFEQRQARNPAYSLRAFARDLKVSPSRLSEVLSRQFHLSAKTADEVAAQLDFDEDERAYFCDLVDSQSARSLARRRQAKARLLKHRFADPATSLRLDQFKVIADWYHFAILELFKTRGCEVSPEWFGAQLGIGTEQAAGALARLTRLGFIKEHNGVSKLVKTRSFTDSAAPSEALQLCHRQFLERAIQALHAQSKAERVTLAAVAAIDKASIEPLRAAIKSLVSEFVTGSAKQADADGVYCMTVQLFQLNVKDGDDADEERH